MRRRHGRRVRRRDEPLQKAGAVGRLLRAEDGAGGIGGWGAGGGDGGRGRGTYAVVAEAACGGQVASCEVHAQ